MVIMGVRTGGVEEGVREEGGERERERERERVVVGEGRESE
jgi:hypothetical protein